MRHIVIVPMHHKPKMLVCGLSVSYTVKKRFNLAYTETSPAFITGKLKMACFIKCLLEVVITFKKLVCHHANQC